MAVTGGILVRAATSAALSVHPDDTGTHELRYGISAWPRRGKQDLLSKEEMQPTQGAWLAMLVNSHSLFPASFWVKILSTE